MGILFPCLLEQQQQQAPFLRLPLLLLRLLMLPLLVLLSLVLAGAASVFGARCSLRRQPGGAGPLN